MTLDEHLTSKRHIENRINLAKAAQHRLSLLLGPKSKLSLNSKRTIYTSIIRPILIYGHPIFMTAHKTILKKLEVFENKMIRKIMSPPWYVRNTILRNDLNIENIKDYIIRQAFKFYEKSEKLENPTLKEATNYKCGKRKIRNLKPRKILHQLSQNDENFNWFNEFKFGKPNLEDEPRSGRPPTAVIQEKIELRHQIVQFFRIIQIQSALFQTNRIFETYIYRIALKIPWTDMVTNKQVLDRMGTEHQLIKFLKQRKLTFAGHVMRGSAGEKLLTVLEGKLQGKRSRIKRRWGYTDDLKQWTGRHTYEEMKRMAVDWETILLLEMNLKRNEKQGNKLNPRSEKRKIRKGKNIYVQRLRLYTSFFVHRTQ
ncbi:hypothetical protein LAZ67_2004380 [Cordylochernes scorpioides]|uniref:Uncharacterized protein n=1 Tax=Cordylochernes scorpioides TaxID=51811 RepID=A0ABY6K8C3_9ARAC|nr:hypothetical protein LAZ67_2004380 [Cordylochernes scorpioides]